MQKYGGVHHHRWLPDCIRYDSYPDCGSESGRWDAKVIGIAGEVRYPVICPRFCS